MCCIETEQSALDLVVCTISTFGNRLLAETLWISTSSCSHLGRLNCCRTLLVIPAKLPESSPLLQLFVTPTHSRVPVLLVWAHHQIHDYGKSWWDQNNHLRGIISHITSSGSNTQTQCPDRACILNLLRYSACLTDVLYNSYTGKILLNCVMRCIIFHIMLIFRILLKMK